MIISSYDPGSMWLCGLKRGQDATARGIAAVIEDIVDQHAQAKIDIFAHGVFCGFLTSMPGCKSADVQWQAPGFTPSENWDSRMLATLDAAGIDIIQLLIDRCRKNNMPFLADLRMNDRHLGSGQCPTFYPRIEKMRSEHPEWLLKEFPGGLDYTYEPVRQVYLDFIAEFLDKYHVDGLELDWMRWCHVFPIASAAESCDLITDFTQQVRTMMDSAAAERSRPRPILVVRVPRSIDECAQLGYDLSAWIKHNLIDYICPSEFLHTDFNIRTEDFVQLTAGTDVKVCPSVHPIFSFQNSSQQLGASEYCAAARNFYVFGAAGISTYNFQGHVDGMLKSQDPCSVTQAWRQSLSLLKDCHAIEQSDSLPRRYAFRRIWAGPSEGHSPTRACNDNCILLDRRTQNPSGSLEFRIAEKSIAPQLAARMSFKITLATEQDQFEFSINDEKISTQSIDVSWHVGQNKDRGRPLPSYCLYSLPVSCPPLRFGDNQLHVRLTNSVGLSDRRLTVQELDVSIE